MVYRVANFFVSTAYRLNGSSRYVDLAIGLAMVISGVGWIVAPRSVFLALGTIEFIYVSPATVWWLGWLLLILGIGTAVPDQWPFDGARSSNWATGISIATSFLGGAVLFWLSFGALYSAVLAGQPPLFITFGLAAGFVAMAGAVLRVLYRITSRAAERTIAEHPSTVAETRRKSDWRVR